MNTLNTWMSKDPDYGLCYVYTWIKLFTRERPWPSPRFQYKLSTAHAKELILLAYMYKLVGDNRARILDRETCHLWQVVSDFLHPREFPPLAISWSSAAFVWVCVSRVKREMFLFVYNWNADKQELCFVLWSDRGKSVHRFFTALRAPQCSSVCVAHRQGVSGKPWLHNCVQ